MQLKCAIDGIVTKRSRKEGDVKNITRNFLYQMIVKLVAILFLILFVSLAVGACAGAIVLLKMAFR